MKLIHVTKKEKGEEINITNQLLNTDKINLTDSYQQGIVWSTFLVKETENGCTFPQSNPKLDNA